MGLKLSNNASSTLATSITDVATSIAVATGAATKFPELESGDWFPVTVVDSSGNREVMKVTHRDAANLTVVRGQEGTTARAFDAGARVEVRLTVAALQALPTPGAISEAEEQDAPGDADQFGYRDNGTGALVRMTWAQIKAAIWSAFGALVATGTAKAAPADADKIPLSDSEATGASKSLTFSALRDWILKFAARYDAAQTLTNTQRWQARANIGLNLGYPLLHVQDQKPSPTNGGSSITASQKRTLNTVLVNEIEGASLSGNDITLPAGDYYVEARAQSHRTDRNRLFWTRNNLTVVLIGQPVYASSTGNSSSIATVSGRFSLAATDFLSVFHYCSQAVADNGLGVNGADGYIEVYTDVKIWKLK